MTLAELIKDFRTITMDREAPYLFDSADVTAWLVEAEQEACIRGRLLHESGNAAVCEIPISAGQSQYPLHAALYEVDYIGLTLPGSPDSRRIKLVSREWLDEHVQDWRERTGVPEYAIQNDTSIRLVPKPDATATLLLEGYRLPLRGLNNQLESKPEIQPAHHRYLVYWALQRAYSIPDSETLDLGRADQAEAYFARYFGARPSSNLRRRTQEDGPHHVKAWI